MLFVSRIKFHCNTVSTIAGFDYFLPPASFYCVKTLMDIYFLAVHIDFIDENVHFHIDVSVHMCVCIYIYSHMYSLVDG